jgi:hypothetical protein
MTGFAKTIAVDSNKANVPNIGWTHFYRRGNLGLCDLDELVTNTGSAYIPKPETVVLVIPKNGQHKGKTRRAIKLLLVADVILEAVDQGDKNSLRALKDLTREGLEDMGITDVVLENGEVVGYLLKDKTFISRSELIIRLGQSTL